MQIRMPLVGDGTTGSPYRVSLPTYKMLDADYEKRLAIVEVPDEDVPEDVRPELAERPPGLKRAARRLPPQARARWREHLDCRYQEHAGEYDPDAD